jgi:hypothetical protein
LVSKILDLKFYISGIAVCFAVSAAIFRKLIERQLTPFIFPLVSILEIVNIHDLLDPIQTAVANAISSHARAGWCRSRTFLTLAVLIPIFFDGSRKV